VAEINFRLDGRTAIITGAGGGIGRAIAVAFASAGGSPILVGRTSASLQEVASEITEKGFVRPKIWTCDVTDIGEMRDRIAELPSLDILVNNAGTNIPGPFTAVTEEVLDAICNLNIRASFLVSQAAILKMLEGGDRAGRDGSVIFITSQMGHVGSPHRTVYCMSKHALEGLAKALAVELAPTGIRVNSVAPTFVDTPLVRRIVDTPEKKEFLFSKIPMGRLATMEDVAAATLYLASPAAAMVTGTSLKVDGGWTAQ
jgi:NAD(P)-dependent dehydrogenase (short-subunit alcohol dehydrogenase family)